jgi:hypothetical protein
MGSRCENSVFLNFYIGVDEICVVLVYDDVSSQNNRQLIIRTELQRKEEENMELILTIVSSGKLV